MFLGPINYQGRITSHDDQFFLRGFCRSQDIVQQDELKERVTWLGFVRSTVGWWRLFGGRVRLFFGGGELVDLRRNTSQVSLQWEGVGEEAWGKSKTFNGFGWIILT